MLKKNDLKNKFKLKVMECKIAISSKTQSAFFKKK